MKSNEVKWTSQEVRHDILYCTRFLRHILQYSVRNRLTKLFFFFVIHFSHAYFYIYAGFYLTIFATPVKLPIRKSYFQQSLNWAFKLLYSAVTEKWKKLDFDLGLSQVRSIQQPAYKVFFTKCPERNVSKVGVAKSWDGV